MPRRTLRSKRLASQKLSRKPLRVTSKRRRKKTTKRRSSRRLTRIRPRKEQKIAVQRPLKPIRKLATIR